VPIIVRKTENKYPLISAGTYNGVCVDVVDEGMVKSNFDGKEKLQPKVSLHWQLDEQRPDKPEERFTIRRRYTASLNKKSTLAKELVAWRGKPFTKEELEAFDLEKLIGVPALITVVHQLSKDGDETYANVASVASPPKGMPKLKAENYTRRKDREDAAYDKSMSDEMRKATDVQFDEDGNEIPF
jgi:hypothetical protein